MPGKLEKESIHPAWLSLMPWSCRSVGSQERIA